ncbi:hypothetical protein CPB84DRAFT_1818103 [Gymnopilus junonius]|uniref:Protein CPL1-like domain-containing protein n=1 Tax=Gymnopilus junonius TaxID=109634 RepID=A0A9P5N8D6_GYMJU|nr:hypothetical protein CPB84DRAFT_1818103 [Gymnopilus junonius]
MQLKIVLTVLAALAPLAASTSVGSKGSNSCKSNEFWYEDRSCCLPNGGPTSPPNPPKGSQCPPTSHYWDDKQACCVPRHQPPPDCPPPQCNKGWDWYSSLHQCKPTSTPSTTPSIPKPSSKPYGGNNNNNHYSNNHKRTTHKARTSLCPAGLDACPVSGLTGDYECLDTSSELESCGGCTTLGQGQDCTAIKDAWNVGCDRGSCVVYTCAGGFKLSPDAKSCVPL